MQNTFRQNIARKKTERTYICTFRVATTGKKSEVISCREIDTVCIIDLIIEIGSPTVQIFYA